MVRVVGPLELMLAFALDGIVGDPRWLPHPVRLIGRAIELAEPALRARIDSERWAGVVLAATVAGGSYLATLAAEKALGVPTSGALAAVCAALMVYLVSTTIALRGLVVSVSSVIGSPDLETARERLGHIVGRDTGDLDEAGVRRAALETLAENTSDGVVAPLFYLAIGGLPLAMAYKAVNTLDSMVGYRNERYRDIGWASARLDDVLNYLPARLTGVLIAAAALLVPGLGANDARRALMVMLRDGRKHPSPNSGMPEAAMAGALGVRLGGPSKYGGVTNDKPHIGDESADAPDRPDPGRALGIAIVASLLALVLAAAVLYVRAGA
jgi:adenosylcobinamide-phosphate synthase